MKQPRHVLLLDAGGPGSMAVMRLIRDAKLPVLVVAADMDAHSPARLVADVFQQIPPASDSAYSDAVGSLIKQYDIELVMPSFHFGYQKPKALDESLFVGSLETALLCQDKWEFYQWLQRHRYDTPETRLLAQTKSIAERSYVKPRYGAGAKDNYDITSNDKLAAVRKLCAGRDYLVQEFVEGQHWSVEALRVGSELLSCSALKVISHKAGNATTVLLEQNPHVTDLCAALLTDLGYEGPANIDLIETAQGYKILEVNPRFGSTVRFVGAAGRNVPAFLLTGNSDWLASEKSGYYTSLDDTVKLSLPTQV